MKEWADNFVMAMHVDDLDSWWAGVQELSTPGGFPGCVLRLPSSKTGACGSCICGTPPGFSAHDRSAGLQRQGLRLTAGRCIRLVPSVGGRLGRVAPTYGTIR